MNKLSKQKFMSMFNEMLTDRNGNKTVLTDLTASNAGDDVDKVNTSKEQSLNMRLDQRNILFLKKVEEAKQKVLEGTYGLCEECDDEISQKRLLARPTAGLCINCQEEKERADFGSFKNRRDLSSKRISDENNSDEHIVLEPKFNKVSDIAFESVVDL